MDKLWVFFPEKIILGIHNWAGNLQNMTIDWLKFVEDKKIAAIDELYYQWHEHEDV